MNTLFTNAVILLPDGSALQGCVGIEGGVIAFIGEVPEGFLAQRVIDCERNILMPAFVNTHAHMPMTLFRSMADDMLLHDWLSQRIWVLEDKYINPISSYWGTLLSCAEMLRNGIAAANDMYFFSDKITEAFILSGMRASVGRCVITMDDGGKSRLDEAEALFDYSGAGDGRINITVAPHAEYTCDIDTLKKCDELAKKKGAKLHIHASETLSEHEECKKRNDGKTPVQLLASLDMLKGSLLAHGVWLDDEDIALSLANDATVLHCPKSNLKLGSGIAPITYMLSQGVNVAMGTDSAASNNNLSILDEMRFACLLQKGVKRDARVLPALQSLQMATANGAKALGINSGVMEVGKAADLIVVDSSQPRMNPRSDVLSRVVYAADNCDVLLTMVNGEVLYEKGEYYTLDIERILHECCKLQEEMD